MNKPLIIFLLLLYSCATFAQKKIIFLGDSLTEGYGVNKEFAYPSIIQKKINDDGKKNFIVINGGISGSTTASGKSRLRWFFKSKPYLIIIALGANDGLRGIKVAESKKNLEGMIKSILKKDLKVILCEMHLPTNYGPEYRAKFNKMYLYLRDKYDIGFIPFLLKDVGGIKEMNIEDGIHPNKAGHRIVANNVYQYLKEYL